MAAGVPLVVGLCASGVVFALGAQHERPAPGAGTYAVPEEMAGYSYVTGSVSSSPPGPAVALFQHGFGVEFMDFPQAVVLGAGGDTYRRVDVAEERAGGETQGDPAPMLLSPDGQYVAVGDHATDDPDVAVVELATGKTTTHPLPQGQSVVPLAWSPDGGSLAILLSDEATNPYSGSRITGDLGLLDLAEDSTDVIDLDGTAATAAFSPDGAELAVERAAPRELTVIALADGSSRTLPLDGVLAGPYAWSPDGATIAVTTVRAAPSPAGTSDPGTPTGLSFLDATGAGGRVPEPLALTLSGPGRVLAWNGDDEVVMLLEVEESDDCCGADTARLSSVPLDGSEPRTLMEIDDLGSYGVGRFQLAADAGGRLTVVELGGVDRGSWPWPQRIVASVLAGLLAWWVAWIVVRVVARVARRRT
jgi:dipeptidyl aminopeptidase/acylaminoacyl peptidase